MQQINTYIYQKKNKKNTYDVSPICIYPYKQTLVRPTNKPRGE